MSLNSHLDQCLGKTICAIVYKTGSSSPEHQVFLVFDDDTAVKFYGERFEWSRGCFSPADLDGVLEYMGRPAAMVFTSPQDEDATPPVLQSAGDWPGVAAAVAGHAGLRKF